MVVQQQELEEGRREVAPLTRGIRAPVDSAVGEADPRIVLGDEHPVLLDRVDRERLPGLLPERAVLIDLDVHLPVADELGPTPVSGDLNGTGPVR